MMQYDRYRTCRQISAAAVRDKCRSFARFQTISNRRLQTGSVPACHLHLQDNFVIQISFDASEFVRRSRRFIF